MESETPKPVVEELPEDFVTKACDMGAHERCRLGARDLQPCQCFCHKKKLEHQGRR